MRVACPLAFVAALLCATFGGVPSFLSAEPDQHHFDALAGEYLTRIRPLMRQLCLDCHSTAARAGELDLERFATLAEVRRERKTWLKVAEMLDNGEMPPKSSKQPAPARRKELRGWVGRYLHAEALASAGRAGSVQVDVVAGVPDSASGLLTSEVTVAFSKVTQVFSDRRDVSFSRAFLAAEDSAAWRRIEAALVEYRRLFPAALCFNQIVPVDEILTLTLFYREDDHLVGQALGGNGERPS